MVSIHSVPISRLLTVAQEHESLQGVLFLHLGSDQSFKIEHFCVSPAHRNLGVGTQLLCCMKDEFAHADTKIWLPLDINHHWLKNFFTNWSKKVLSLKKLQKLVVFRVAENAVHILTLKLLL